MSAEEVTQDVAALLLALAPGLVLLDAIAGTGSVTSAARVGGVSQPTLTRAMVRWETASGTRLFDRSHRAIALTPAGRLLAASAGAALSTLRSELSADPVTDGLVVGSLRSVGHAVLPELVTSFVEHDGPTRVRLIEGSSSDVWDMVRSGAVHLGITDLPDELTGFEWHRLGWQSLSLVVPIAEAPAGRRAVRLEDFAERPFVALDRRFRSRLHADRLWAEAGVTPKVVLESDDSSRVRDYVATGQGVAILPTDLSLSPRVRYLPIESPLAFREFGVLVDATRARSAAVARFCNHVDRLEVRYPGWADLLDH